MPAGRVDGRKKAGEFGKLPRFFDFEQQFGLALQIVITRAASSGGPGKLQRFVVRSEFNRKIRLHASARVAERFVAQSAEPPPAD